MTSLLAVTLGHSSGVAVGRLESGGLGVALPCTSAKRSLFLKYLTTASSPPVRGPSCEK